MKNGIYKIFGVNRFYTVRKIAGGYAVYTHTASGRIIRRKVFTRKACGWDYHRQAVQYARDKAMMSPVFEVGGDLNGNNLCC